MRLPWFFNTKTKKVQIGDSPSVGKVGMQGGELNVNPNTNVTLDRAKGRLRRINKAIQTSKNEEKLSKLKKTREKLKALVFILEEED